MRASGTRAWALLVSNTGRSVALLSQLSGRGREGLVLWDYHVLALAVPAGGGLLALDLDSRLPFPCAAESWLAASCPSDPPRNLAALFRLIEAPEYLSRLSSDRSHMRGADGSWKATPPPWEPYCRPGGNNLLEWIDMEKPAPGRVMDRAALASFAAAIGASAKSAPTPPGEG